MKKLLFVISVALVGCVPACSPKPEKLRAITAIENLPSGECVYSVEGDTVPYTFIDSVGKYSVGQQF